MIAYGSKATGCCPAEKVITNICNNLQSMDNHGKES
jgi:hypothetical protein